MANVSKFISMEEECEMINEGLKSNADAVETAAEGTNFRVAKSNLPAKQTSLWSKLKGILTYEIKVELTPYEQKVEDEINEFLHQDVTWQSFKNFLFQEVTFGSKKSNT